MNNLSLNLVNGLIISAVTAALIILPLTAASLVSSPSTHQNLFTATQSTTLPVTR